jgi:hypothetical protein
MDLPTVYITSRASAGESVPRGKVSQTLIPRGPLSLSVSVHVPLITVAPASSCAGRVVHVAALRGLAVSGWRWCERRTLLAACSGTMLGWL